jgi:hypothetical protein
VEIRKSQGAKPTDSAYFSTRHSGVYADLGIGAAPVHGYAMLLAAS